MQPFRKKIAAIHKADSANCVLREDIRFRGITGIISVEPRQVRSSSTRKSVTRRGGACTGATGGGKMRVAAGPGGRVPPTPAPTSPTVPATPASKLPRFLRSPTQHDRLKSLLVDPPPSVRGIDIYIFLERRRAVLSSTERGGAAHPPRERRPPTTLNTTIYGRRVVRLAPTAAAVPPLARICARNGTNPSRGRRRRRRRPHRGIPTGARERCGAVERVVRAYLSLTTPLSGALSQSTGIAAALASSTTLTSRKSESGGGGAKKRLLDKAVRYVLDGEAAPDRSAQEIWLLGVRLPDWASRTSGAQAQQAYSHATPNPIPTRPTPAATTGSSTWGRGARASMYAAFYAQVCGTYRAGFEPISDLLSHASLPPPLFVAANHHTPNNHASGSLPLSPSQSDGSVSSAPSYSSTHSHNSHADGAVRRGRSHLSTASTRSSASTGIGISNNPYQGRSFYTRGVTVVAHTREISNSRRMALPKSIARRLHELRHLRDRRSESTSPDFVRGQAPMKEGERVCAADKTNGNTPHDQHQQPNDDAGP
ncbi:hypothetical protein FB451DRAFT_1525819 [Mycena latifolia]|nr:hypothetical protein FB451DRAFT_1525819 [Mycena latifolia]